MAPVPDVELEDPDRGGRREGGALSLDDCRCPVCLEIFVEPVTLPCTHTFCKGCFLESVDKATLCCPLCRKRVSTWARLNSKNNTLVNQRLWKRIQTSFPLQCQRRLSGQDVVPEDEPGVSVRFPRVSEPGELRQEYEDQVTKLIEEKRVLDEEERRASEEYIQRLLAEEEELLQEERRRGEDDERLAQLLSNELNSAAICQENIRPVAVTPAKKRKISSGQIEKFLCPRPSKTSSSDCGSASSFSSNKENILLSQVKLQAERPPPQPDYNDDGSESPDLGPAPLSASVEDLLHSGSHRSHLTRDGGSSSAKRKSSEAETTEDEEGAVCHSLPSPSLEVGPSVLQGIAEWETELQSRWQQEEEDRRLALHLQKELDSEEKRRAIDRRKGSLNPYLLRRNHRGKVETSRPLAKTSTPPSASSVKTTKTSTPPSASSVKTKSWSSASNRGSKQATLTEMFSRQDEHHRRE